MNTRLLRFIERSANVVAVSALVCAGIIACGANEEDLGGQPDASTPADASVLDGMTSTADASGPSDAQNVGNGDGDDDSFEDAPSGDATFGGGDSGPPPGSCTLPPPYDKTSTLPDAGRWALTLTTPDNETLTVLDFAATSVAGLDAGTSTAVVAIGDEGGGLATHIYTMYTDGSPTTLYATAPAGQHITALATQAFDDSEVVWTTQGVAPDGGAQTSIYYAYSDGTTTVGPSLLTQTPIDGQVGPGGLVKIGTVSAVTTDGRLFQVTFEGSSVEEASIGAGAILSALNWPLFGGVDFNGPGGQGQYDYGGAPPTFSFFNWGATYTTGAAAGQNGEYFYATASATAASGVHCTVMNGSRACDQYPNLVGNVMAGSARAVFSAASGNIYAVLAPPCDLQMEFGGDAGSPIPLVLGQTPTRMLTPNVPNSGDVFLEWLANGKVNILPLPSFFSYWP